MPQGGKPNFLKTAKQTLPNNQRNLTHLNLETGETIDDPSKMADALKNFWEPLWNQPHPTQATIEHYLDGYNKNIKTAIPTVSLQLVEEVIGRCKDSSTGPDGIPFSVYRGLKDIFAPLIYQYFLHLSLTRKANRSFNYTNLFFFPKDSSNALPNLRPISVSNADNRIIANVLRALITPAVAEILDKSQRAFMPEASIEDNISFFNQAFYSHVGDDTEYHLLLHDFAKAYDSISLHYLFSILKKIGLPWWVLNVLEVLFTRVVATPILQGGHDVTIAMSNGLKQGCPLSPLLFNLALDPLLSRLSRVASITSKAYADDIGLGATTLAELATALPLIDDYNEASGGRTSTKKTLLLSTTATDEKDVAGAFPKSGNL